jgi:uncharacterized protein (TIGR00725 family)
MSLMGKYQICVSGAAKGESAERGKLMAESVGTAVAKAGHSLMTGATTGLPNDAANGYKKAGGRMSLGISPAATKVEHVLKYHLPTESYDTILFSGLHYSGRDALLINSADAVVSIGGRLGTLHEFTIAMETHTPVGLLEGAGGVGEQIEQLLKILPNANPDLVISDSDPDKLVERLTHMLDKLHSHYKRLYS